METKKKKTMIYFVVSLFLLFAVLGSDSALLVVFSVANCFNALRLMRKYFPEQFEEQE